MTEQLQNNGRGTKQSTPLGNISRIGFCERYKQTIHIEYTTKDGDAIIDSILGRKQFRYIIHMGVTASSLHYLPVVQYAQKEA